jgi:hypothetical protein
LQEAAEGPDPAQAVNWPPDQNTWTSAMAFTPLAIGAPAPVEAAVKSNGTDAPNAPGPSTKKNIVALATEDALAVAGPPEVLPLIAAVTCPS